MHKTLLDTKLLSCDPGALYELYECKQSRRPKTGSIMNNWGKWKKKKNPKIGRVNHKIVFKGKAHFSICLSKEKRKKKTTVLCGFLHHPFISVSVSRYLGRKPTTNCCNCKQLNWIRSENQPRWEVCGGFTIKPNPPNYFSVKVLHWKCIILFTRLWFFFLFFPWF